MADILARTSGIEIEIPGVPPDGITEHVNRVSGLEFQYSDDGSVRGDVQTIDNIPILALGKKKHLPNGYRSGRAYGLELVSRPYSWAMWKERSPIVGEVLSRIPNDLAMNASIHVHIDTANLPWTFVRNLVKWYYKLEALVYRISALGMVHRGVYNDYKFTRPLSAPICWYDDGTLMPIMNIGDVMAAKSASQLMKSWGRLDLSWGEIPHYCPQRLHVLNLVPLQTLGTTEVRAYNGEYRYLPFIIDFSFSMFNLAMEQDADDYPHTHLLGDAPELSEQHYSNLLQLDFGKIFRITKWQRGIDDVLRSHHYNAYHTPSLDSRMKRISTMSRHGERDSDDDGTSEYCFFRR